MNNATRFASSLGIRWPVFQAPTGSVASPRLAATVSDAGGLGALAATWSSPSEARKLLAEVRLRTARPVQVNFVMAFQPRALGAVLDAGVQIITFSWGLPAAEISLVHSFGARCGIQVSSIEGARQALGLGADFLICQGVEAGGHVQATRSLWEVLPEVLAVAADIPVVASGGIGSGKGIARAISEGASGAMLGTRYVATRESLAHPWYKHKLVRSDAADAVLTVCYDLGWPYAAHRVLRNSTLRTWEGAGCPPSGRRPGEGDRIARAGNRNVMRYQDVPPRVGMRGRLEAMPLYAGVSCGEVRDVPSAGELTRRLWRACRAEYARTRRKREHDGRARRGG